MWIIFSILSALSSAISEMIDKYILTKWVRKPTVPIIMYGAVGLIASAIVYFVCGISYLSYFNILFALIAGIFHVLMTIFYFRALKTEEVSRISTLFYLSPLFVLIFAGIFLGETFAPIKYLGIILLITGAILISLKSFSKIIISKSSLWMMMSITFLSVYLLLMKYILNFTDYWTVFFYARIGASIGLIPIVCIYLPDLIGTVKMYGKKVVFVMSASEAINLLSILFLTIAASVGYITLVNTLSSVEPFFVFLFIVILSIFHPSILKEEIKRSVLLQKFIAITLMFIGAILIT